MPAMEISQSMLLNRGLSVFSAVTDGQDGVAPDAATPAIDFTTAVMQRLAVAPQFTVDHGMLDLLGTARAPLDQATLFINLKYEELGGTNGVLGTTTGAVLVTPDNAGFMRSFEHGVIYWQSNVGAHELHGPILARWRELHATAGFLGFPVSDVTPGNDVRSQGCFASFQGGYIFWAPSTQVRISPAALNTVSAQGIAVTTATPAKVDQAANINLATATRLSPALSSSLALGANSAANVANVASKGNGTDGHDAAQRVIGKIDGPAMEARFDPSLADKLMPSSAGAFEVHGDILRKYLALGAEASILGYPRTDETGTPDGVGRFNHFQGGSIYWTPSTSAHEVHGLIRDLWASQGWERNVQLGYPVSDELIPDPRLGHRRPETLKKPVVSLPPDVVKLPAAAAHAGFPSAVVNLPVAGIAAAPAPITARSPVTPATNNAELKPVGTLGKLADNPGRLAALTSATPALDATFESVLPGGLQLQFQGASTPAPERSANRFAEFENGVLFWSRGASAARLLAPLASTSDGTKLSYSGPEIATAVNAKIGNALQVPNVQLAGISYIGTTSLSFDGAQLHNRRHRLAVAYTGVEPSSIPPFGGLHVPGIATVELQVEVWFDAAQRRLALTPVDWILMQSSTGTFSEMVTTALFASLDPLLWSAFELVTLPDTDAGNPIAVLCVKTLPNGAVSVFIEPRGLVPLSGIALKADIATPVAAVSTLIK